MKKLIILTGSFPYGHAEPFIESEIPYWGKSKFNHIYLLPAIHGGIQRDIPSNITILKSNYNYFDKVVSVFYAIFSLILFKEILYILTQSKKNTLKKIYIALKTVAITYLNSLVVKRTIKNINGDVYVYSYWNDVQCYAACMLKRNQVIKGVYSRAHGYDIYQNRRDFGYMPLKRQFSKDVDVVYLLSESAKQYYHDCYNYSNEKLVVSRLGVFLPREYSTYHKNEKKIRVLSLSNCIPVKRIDKIIQALRDFSIKYPMIKIEWVHIGSGYLFETLKTQAIEYSSTINNLDIDFLGQMTNRQVQGYLRDNSIDIFINASESEGIPVSIMEAMSYGIPAIAPNVGGIADIVQRENGYLMSENAEIEEIVVGLETIYFSDNIEFYRDNSHLWVEKYFNAEKNYQNFVVELEKIIINE